MWVLPLAGHDAAELRRRAGDLAGRLTGGESPASAWPEITATAGPATHRCVVTGKDAGSVADRLAEVAAGRTVGGAEQVVVSGPPARAAFVYPGLGTGYPGMGAGLAGHPAFATAAQDCDRIVRDLAGWSPIAEAAGGAGENRLADSAIGPPTLIAVQLALTNLLESWGIVPDLVLGHSLGEITAAAAAGALTRADALAVACHEGSLLRRGRGAGRMLAVGLGAADTAALLRAHPELTVAAYNGPAATVVSGPPQPLARLAGELSERKIFQRDLGIDFAFHHPRMGGYAEEMAGVLAGIRPAPGRVPLISTVSGGPLPGERLDAQHWAGLPHLPVRFAAAVAAAAEHASVFLEISPTPELGAVLAQCLAGHPAARVVTTLRAGRDDEDSLRRTAAALYLAGMPVHWPAVPPAGPSTADGDRRGMPAASPSTADGDPAAPGQAVRRVAALVAELVGERAERIAVDAGLFELGLDSGGAVELARRLGEEFGAAVPVTVAFDHPSVEALAAYFGEPGPSQARDRTARRDPDQPVAIVGMGCRVPGADSVDAFWELLLAGTDATTELPTGRWDPALHGGNAQTPGTIASPRGGFLPEVDQFDAAFFGISPVEAEGMDPQQRLLLEVAWHALEDAHLPADRLRGARCGVYVGISTDDYKALQFADPLLVDAYAGTGTAFSVAAGRLSYLLGLRGPSIAVDTACSSSLVSVHLASQALRAGECDVALAGGVNLMLGAGAALSLSRAGALSPSGRCRSFDAAADGYARGEGCGVLVLKRLSDAVRAGDRIVALIRGSAVNHDGASSGLTVPSGPAQQDLIRDALAAAGVLPDEVDYVEAHGSATPLGDPIELTALGTVCGELRPADRPLVVGSAKTNIGHLEAAAGVLGVIKAALAVRHGRIPAHLHLTEPSPRIPWADLAVEIPVTTRAWPHGGAAGARVAGVSSFGIGGTNAHVVIAGPPEPPPTGPTSVHPAKAAVLLPLSARDPGAVAALCQAYATRLAEGVDPGDLAAAAATGRTALPHRTAVVARGSRLLAERAAAMATGAGAPDCATGVAPATAPVVAFAFCGQGGQYHGMAAGLAAEEPVFAAALQRCDALAEDLLGGSVLAAVHGPDPEAVHRPDHAHMALFAVQYALVELWESWGVRPAVVLGHSVGEIAAACTAGVLSLPDALSLVAVRGRLMRGLPPGGRMVTVQAGRDEVADLLDRHGVDLAAENSPQDVVISGPGSAVASVVAELDRRGVPTKDLTVSFAGHSRLVDEVLPELEACAAALTHRTARIPIVSALTGTLLPAGAMDAGYWRRNAREPVRFLDAARSLREQGAEVVVDIGPEPLLGKAAARAGLPGTAGGWLASLRRGADDRTTMLAAAGAAWSRGVGLDWPRVTGEPRRAVALPRYPFQRRRHWRDTTPSVRPEGHPLIGRRLDSPAIAGVVFESRVGTRLPAHFADHGVYGEPVAAAAFHLAAVLTALAETGDTAQRLEDVAFTEALHLGTAPVTIQVILDPPGARPLRTFKVVSRVDGTGPQWTVHARGRLAPGTEPAGTADEDATASGGDAVAALHDKLQAAGYQIGPSFRWWRSVSVLSGRAAARLERPAAALPVAGIHPGLIDSCLRVLLAAAPAFLDGTDRAALPVPASIALVAWRGGATPLDAGELRCRARLRDAECSPDALTADLDLHADGAPVAELRGVRVRAVPRELLLQPFTPRYELAWRPVPAPPAPAGATDQADWVVLSADDEADAVATHLARLVERCHVSRADAMPDLAALPRLRGVIVVAGSDPAELPTSDLVARQHGGLLAALRVVRAAAGVAVPRLVLATTGVYQVVPEDLPGPGHATMHGLVRVIRLEHPELGCTALDLPAVDPAAAAQAVRAVLLGAPAEAQLAVRDGRWYAPRLRPAPAPGGSAPRIRPDGTYLVTGGGGAIGGHVARWLADQGAGRVYLLGRNPPAPGTWPDRSTHGRTELRWITCDVSDPEAVARAVGPLRAENLRGVVHAAGVLAGGTLRRISAERLLEPVLPKLAGAWNLHLAAEGADLDFFLLFSSLAAMVGNPGQAGYAAGNAFLDALAAHRRRRGQVATSIAWGPWDGDGMVGRLGDRERQRLTGAGISLLTAAEATTLLGTAAMGPPLLVAARADWAALARPGDGLLAELAGADPGTTAEDTHPRPAISTEYRPAGSECERILVGLWEQLFRISPIGVADNFFELGGDSILALRVLAAARDSGLHFDGEDLFTRPTIAQLAAAVPGLPVASPAAVPGPPVASPAAVPGPAVASPAAGPARGRASGKLRAADFPDTGLDDTDLALLAGRLDDAGRFRQEI